MRGYALQKPTAATSALVAAIGQGPADSGPSLWPSLALEHAAHRRADGSAVRAPPTARQSFALLCPRIFPRSKGSSTSKGSFLENTLSLISRLIRFLRRDFYESCFVNRPFFQGSAPLEVLVPFKLGKDPWNPRQSYYLHLGTPHRSACYTFAAGRLRLRSPGHIGSGRFRS